MNGEGGSNQIDYFEWEGEWDGEWRKSYGGAKLRFFSIHGVSKIPPGKREFLMEMVEWRGGVVGSDCRLIDGDWISFIRLWSMVFSHFIS